MTVSICANPPRTKAAPYAIIPPMLQRLRQPLPAAPSRELLALIAAALLLALGAALRLYALGEIPPGLHKDEATAGYEAWALLNYGIDRNGFSWPVLFIDNAASKSVLYSYLTMPFIALGGLNALVLRIPMALAGILALFLMWKIGMQAGGRGFALLVLLLLTFNSWHLMASRWALEVNLLPFLLLLSVYFLARPDRDRLLIQALAVSTLSLSVYAYGTAYALAPLLLALVFSWLLLNRLADWRRLAVLAALSLTVTLPIILMLMVNTFDLDSIVALGVSIPRGPGPQRYELNSLLFRNPDEGIFANIPAVTAMLLGGADVSQNPTSALPGFGALPPFAILLSLVGFGVALYRAKRHQDYGIHLLVAFWFVAALLVALLTQVNIQRMNAIWLPALYLMALGIFTACRPRPLLYAVAAIYLAFSSVFVYQYFRNYSALAAEVFNVGLDAALQRAVGAAGDAVIAVHIPEFPSLAAVYPLFYLQIPPPQYLEKGVIAGPYTAFYPTRAYGQFVFVSPLRAGPDSFYRRLLQSGGINLDTVAHHILTAREAAELDANQLLMERYGQYYYIYDPSIPPAAIARGPLQPAARPPVSEPPSAYARFNIYQQDNALTYYKAPCNAYDTREPFFLHLIPARAADLPADRQPLGFANRDFRFNEYGALYGPNCWAVIPLPDYPIAAIKTGQFIAGKGELWRAEFPAAQ